MALPTLNQVIPHLATGANPLRPLPTHTRPSGRSNATVHSERSQSCDGALKSSWRWLGTAVAAAALSAQAAFSPPSFAMASPQAEALQQHTERTVPYAMTSPEVLGRLPPLPANFPQLPPLRRPNFERFTLPSGLRVILLEDHEALLVRGVMLMRGGQRANPPGKVGLASISAAAQRAGGSKAHPGQGKAWSPSFQHCKMNFRATVLNRSVKISLRPN